MATKSKYTGVTQWSGGWQYRIKKKTEDGKVVDTKIKYDIDGKPFKTAKSANEAREAHLQRLKEKPVETPTKPSEALLCEVYENYLKTLSKERAAGTLSKQETMWRVHIEPVFGKREINSISILEIKSFLLEMYSKYSFEYTKSYMKFFYLLFSQGYLMEVYDSEKYTRNFVTSDTRLRMPPKKQKDKEEDLKGVEVYDDFDIYRIINYFGKEHYMILPIYLGLYCGLRKSEVFGLRWKNVDLDSLTITIDRQLLKDKDIWKLYPVKTLNSIRTVVIPSVLYEELEFRYSQYLSNKKTMGNKYKDHDRVYDEVEKEWIESCDLVCRKPTGEMMTVDSLKYWTKKIKKEINFDFRFHALRHTFATRLAKNNIPLLNLQQLLGHHNIQTTLKYYVNKDELFVKNQNISMINDIYKNIDNPHSLIIKENKEEGEG